MKAKDYVVLVRAIEEGVESGIRRFYKHRDDLPDDADINEMADIIGDHILQAISAVFMFEEDEE